MSATKTEISWRSDMTVELIDSMGNDRSVVRAARVSTGKDWTAGSVDDPYINHAEHAGLIKFLMVNRHGTPFEHGSFTFRIEAPIFVWREFMRHRIGFSYNEQSGRYMEMIPSFYIPAADRNLVQIGKAGKYDFVPGDEDQYLLVIDQIEHSNKVAWDCYQRMLRHNVAKEVARLPLPVNIYSSAYVTCNARSLMSFLSLRTKSDLAKFPSFPQREIEMVAEEMENMWSNHMPITWQAFNDAGRVAP